MPENVPLFVYREKVEALARKRDGTPLYNDSVEHAAIILQSMLSSAQRSVKVLTGELNKEAYGRRAIVDQVKQFIEDESHSLQILYEDKTLEQEGAKERHPFLEAVAGKSRVELRHVPEQLQSRYEFHFMVVDGDCYRFEPNKEKFGAVAVFGDTQGGENLEELFSTLWSSSDDEWPRRSP